MPVRLIIFKRAGTTSKCTSDDPNVSLPTQGLELRLQGFSSAMNTRSEVKVGTPEGIRTPDLRRERAMS